MVAIDLALKCVVNGTLNRGEALPLSTVKKAGEPNIADVTLDGEKCPY